MCVLTVFSCSFFQLAGEEAQRLNRTRLDHEKARREATADMSEDLSEGEKGDSVGDLPGHGSGGLRSRMKRISSMDMMANWANQHKERKLYIVLIRFVSLSEVDFLSSDILNCTLKVFPTEFFPLVLL